MPPADRPPAGPPLRARARLPSEDSFSRRGRLACVFVAYLLGIVSVLGFRAVVGKTALAHLAVRPLVVADTAGSADVIVVPGAGVTDLCTPNQNSVRRVLLAARLFRAGRAPVVLFAGGPPHGQSCSVAEVMAGLAREVGVPAERIQVETSSLSTRQNAEFSAPMLRALGARRLLIATDLLHMRRTTGAYAVLGFHTERASVPVEDGHRDDVEMLYWGLREYVALGYYRFMGWVGEQ